MRPGIQFQPLEDPLRIGDTPQRMRILDARLDASRYIVRLQGRRGHTYRARLIVPFAIASVDGATLGARSGSGVEASITFDGAEEWVSKTVTIALGKRTR